MSRCDAANHLALRQGQHGPQARAVWFVVTVLLFVQAGHGEATCRAAGPAPMPVPRHESPEPAPLPPTHQDELPLFQPQIQQAPVPARSTVEGLAPVISPLPDQAIPEPAVDATDDASVVSEDTLRASPEFFRGTAVRGRPDRFSGRGQPLIQESWNFRPYSIGGIFGLVQGSSLIEDWIRETEGVLGGFQLGWDGTHYWGFETRLAWAKIEVIDSDRAIAAQIAQDDAAGLSQDDLFRRRFYGRRYNRVFFWDAHALYYPWGDSAFRPYFMAGLGATAMSFIDRTDVSYKDTLFTFPFGVGFKYRMNDFFALRVEAADFMAFGGGQTLELIHHVTVIGGLEVRFGGSRRAYWPWNPGRHYW